MPYYCTVPQCKSLSGKIKNVSFHGFPKNKRLSRLWNKLLRKERPPTKYSKVCSLHFTDKCFRTLKVDRYKDSFKKLLQDAVPTLNLPITKREAEAAKNKVLKAKESKRQTKKLKCSNKSVELGNDLDISIKTDIDGGQALQDDMNISGDKAVSSKKSTKPKSHNNIRKSKRKVKPAKKKERKNKIIQVSQKRSTELESDSNPIDPSNEIDATIKTENDENQALPDSMTLLVENDDNQLGVPITTVKHNEIKSEWIDQSRTVESNQSDQSCMDADCHEGQSESSIAGDGNDENFTNEIDIDETYVSIKNEDQAYAIEDQNIENEEAQVEINEDRNENEQSLVGNAININKELFQDTIHEDANNYNNIENEQSQYEIVEATNENIENEQIQDVIYGDYIQIDVEPIQGTNTLYLSKNLCSVSNTISTQTDENDFIHTLENNLHHTTNEDDRQLDTVEMSHVDAAHLQHSEQELTTRQAESDESVCGRVSPYALRNTAQRTLQPSTTDASPIPNKHSFPSLTGRRRKHRRKRRRPPLIGIPTTEETGPSQDQTSYTSLALLNKAQLLSRVYNSIKGISKVANHSNRLTTSEKAVISGHSQDILATVASLELRLAQMEHEVTAAKFRCSMLEIEVESAKSSASFKQETANYG